MSTDENSKETSDDSRDESQTRTNGTSDTETQAPDANTSFASIEVADGNQEATTLSDQDVAHRQELRYDSTRTWAAGQSNVFHRGTDHPYTDPGPSTTDASDQKK